MPNWSSAAIATHNKRMKWRWLDAAVASEDRAGRRPRPDADAVLRRLLAEKADDRTDRAYAAASFVSEIGKLSPNMTAKLRTSQQRRGN